MWIADSAVCGRPGEHLVVARGPLDGRGADARDLLAGQRAAVRRVQDERLPEQSCGTRLATTHHSFLGSFSAVSKRIFATKYAFFQVFRDLQNYLAVF